MVKVLNILVVIFLLSLKISAQIKVETTTSDTIRGDEKILLSTINDLGSRKFTNPDSLSKYTGHDRAKKTSIFASYSAKITNSTESAIIASENCGITSLSQNNIINASKNSNIASLPTANSEYSGVYNSENCVIYGGFKDVIIASRNSTINGGGSNIALIGCNDCNVINAPGYLTVRGHNQTVNTDGSYNDINGSGNTLGTKSYLSSVLNGFQLYSRGAHNTFINGQNSEIKSDAASFHGFNTHLNGENNLFDSVSYNGILGIGLIGYTSYQFSLGAYNVNKKAITQQKVLWNYNDDLITIGNGGDVNNRSNALTLKKSGKFQINSISGSKSIGDVEPEVTAEFIGTDAVAIPAGTTAERPINPINNTTKKSYIRYNITTGKFEGFDLNTSTWVNLN